MGVRKILGECLREGLLKEDYLNIHESLSSLSVNNLKQATQNFY